MEEQVNNQIIYAESSPEEKKKQKFKELSAFWKGMVIRLSLRLQVWFSSVTMQKF